MPAVAPRASIAVHDGPVVDRVGGYDVIDCAACGFVHVAPLPAPEDLRLAYEREYYADEKPDYLKHAAEDAAWSDLAAGDRLDALAEACGGAGLLIEFGSGPGFFLDAAEARGWRAVGVEPSRQAAAFARARGREVVNAFVEDAARDGLPFADAVAATNVLEHVPDPAAILGIARRILRPGGAICVTVPNDYSPMQRAARAGGLEPWWLAPPHHLNYFGFASLERLLARCGFAPVARQTSFPMEAFLLMGDDYVSQPPLGRALHAKRKAFDLALPQGDRRAFYAALAAAGFGREATVVAVKEGP